MVLSFLALRSFLLVFFVAIVFLLLSLTTVKRGRL